MRAAALRAAGAADALLDRLCEHRLAQQFGALFYKNALLAWRGRRATAIRLSAPLVFLVLALIVDRALNINAGSRGRFAAAPRVEPAPVPGVPDCRSDLYIAGRACVDFVYTPDDDPDVNAIVAAVRSNNAPPIPAGRVVALPDRAAADAYMAARPDGVLGAVHFTRLTNTSIAYVVASNSTLKYFKGTFQDPTTFFSVPLMSAVARELARHFAASAPPGAAAAAALRLGGAGALQPPGELEWAPALAPFPHPSLQTSSSLGQVLAVFIFASLMFGCVAQISGLVSEREAGLKLALRTAGMRDAAYWLSWMAWDGLFALATAVILLVSGLILRFAFFTRNSAGLLLVLFWLFGLALAGFSYMASTMVSRGASAVYLGFGIFIVGWMFQAAQLVAELPYTPEFYYSTTNRWGKVLFWVFTLLPWCPLTKGILDLNAATLTDTDPGLRWGEQWSYCAHVPDPAAQAPVDPAARYVDYDCIFPLWQVYVTLLVQWTAYWALAVWLSNVLPNERRRDAAAPPGRCADGGAEGAAPVDSDVAAEEASMRALLAARVAAAGGASAGAAPAAGKGSAAAAPPPPPPAAAELFGLAKTFPARTGAARRLGAALLPRAWRRGRGAAAPADRGRWLRIAPNQLFALLGPNGAGKTTTINCLTGVLPLSGGEALVCGRPVGAEGGLDALRPLMGVCPQFDVLWGELSGAEHLAILGHIKGLPRPRVRAEAAALLARVALTGAAGRRSAAYSGGMRRRLSVALSLLGDPAIVFMDEPTRGMDPISRRAVWGIIQEAKQGRAVVLTTHSMEEADVLGDRIGIMARGRLRALGTAHRLKHKFGSGYQLTLHYHAGGGDGSDGSDGGDGGDGGGAAAAPQPAQQPAEQQAQQAQQQVQEQQEAAAERLERIKELFREGLGLEPSEHDPPPPALGGGGGGEGRLTYLVPRGRQAALGAFLERLEAARARLGVRDVCCGLASLEEVFLNTVRAAELEEAARTGAGTVAVDLPGGGTLQVPLGDEGPFEVPGGGGRTVRVAWGQDDEGRLVVVDCAEASEGGVTEGA
ncbi:ABCA2 [Scenedesmus sp. PABB004]|nr:ABCA2 [Scenedesmus sp. PABB004]